MVINPKITIQKLQASLGTLIEYGSIPHSIRHIFEKSRNSYPNSVLGRYWKCGYFIMGGMSGPILYADRYIRVLCDDGVVLEPMSTYETYKGQSQEFSVVAGSTGVSVVTGYTGCSVSTGVGGFKDYIEKKYFGEEGVVGVPNSTELKPKESPKTRDPFTKLPKRRINWD